MVIGYKQLSKRKKKKKKNPKQIVKGGNFD